MTFRVPKCITIWGLSILLLPVVYGADTNIKEEAANDKVRIILKESNLSDFQIPQKGEVLTPEILVRWQVDSTLTSLAKKAFMDAADNATINWTVVIEDLIEQPDKIYGEFSIPYRVVNDNGWSGSSIRLAADFPLDQRAQFLSLRRYDVVNISGKLNINRLVIKDAEITVIESE